MKENQQSAPQMMSETFTGKQVRHESANKMDPTADVETRQPATQNDKGSK